MGVSSRHARALMLTMSWSSPAHPEHGSQRCEPGTPARWLRQPTSAPAGRRVMLHPPALAHVPACQHRTDDARFYCRHISCEGGHQPFLARGFRISKAHSVAASLATRQRAVATPTCHASHAECGAVLLVSRGSWLRALGAATRCAIGPNASSVPMKSDSIGDTATAFTPARQ